MIKFKVGDYVYVKSSSVVFKHSPWSKFCNKRAKITRVRYFSDLVSAYALDIDNGEFNWMDYELEPIPVSIDYIKEI